MNPLPHKRPGSIALNISGVPSAWCIVSGTLIITRKLAAKPTRNPATLLPKNAKTFAAVMPTIQVENRAYVACPRPERTDTNIPYSLLTNAAHAPKTIAASSGANRISPLLITWQSGAMVWLAQKQARAAAPISHCCLADGLPSPVHIQRQRRQ